jgi:hypothetical protein
MIRPSPAHRARDLDQLLFGHCEIAGFRIWIDTSANSRQQLFRCRRRTPIDATEIDDSPRRWRCSQQRSFREERRLLINRRDPSCLARRGDFS